MSTPGASSAGWPCTSSVGVEARAADLLDQLVRRGAATARARGRARTCAGCRASGAARRPPGGRSPRSPQRLTLALARGIGAEQAAHAAGLQDHHGHAVGDGVVQLARDPRAFLDDRRAGLLLALAAPRARRGARRRRGALPARARSGRSPTRAGRSRIARRPGRDRRCARCRSRSPRRRRRRVARERGPQAQLVGDREHQDQLGQERRERVRVVGVVVGETLDGDHRDQREQRGTAAEGDRGAVDGGGDQPAAGALAADRLETPSGRSAGRSRGRSVARG